MGRPNVEVAGTTYRFDGRIYIEGAAITQGYGTSVWAARAYIDNIFYTEATIEAAVGTTGHGFGDQIIGFGYVGDTRYSSF